MELKRNERAAGKTLLNRFFSSRRGDAYVVLIFLVALAFFAVIWFVFFSSDGWVTRVANAMEPVHVAMGSDQHESYDTVTTFVSTFSTYFLVVTLILLIIGGIVYVQRRRAEAYLG